jgi:4-hydroxybenzoate polyprenyltransferase
LTLLARVRDEFVLGGHLLALGTSSMAAAAALLAGRNPTLALVLMAYLFSFGAYMTNRTTEFEQDAVANPKRTSYLAGRRRLLPAEVLISFAVGYAIAATVSLPFFVALLAPLGLTLAYSVGTRMFVPALEAKNLKQKFLLKNITISFGWCLTPALVGLYFGQVGNALIALAPLIFLRLMFNTILFDLRDIEGDRENGIATIPTRLGASATLRVVSVLDLLSAVYLVAVLALGLLPIWSATLLVLPVYSTVYRWYASRPNPNFNLICDVVADGEYLMWGPLVFLGRLFI